MQELFVAADVLISDYSSCLPEYCILKKKSFIYATDIDSYEPGFYFPLSDLPSPIAKNNYDTVSDRLKLQENDSYLVSRKEEIGTANIIDSLVKQEELLLVRQQNVSSKVNEIIASINLYKATGGVDVFTTSNNNDL